MSLSKKEILEETIKYYKENPRAVVIDEMGEEVGECMYYSPEGNMCAVGRCLINPQEFKNVDFDVAADALFETYGKDEILKEPYRGHEDDFWRMIQNLHDNIMAWTKDINKKRNELTDRGYEIIRNICEDFDIDFYSLDI